jgi:DNA primase
MSSGTAKDFENYARDCVRLAEQMDSPELREKLLQQAREWMHAVIDEEEASGATEK